MNEEKGSDAIPLLWQRGSGSHEADGPFQIVAVKKKVQASRMHQRRFGERERFANKSAKTLPKGIIPALDMSRFTCLFTYRCMLLFWDNSLICTPEISVTMSSAIAFWNSIPQLTTGLLTSVSNSSCNHLSGFSAESNPNPNLMCLL